MSESENEIKSHSTRLPSNIYRRRQTLAGLGVVAILMAVILTIQALTSDTGQVSGSQGSEQVENTHNQSATDVVVPLSIVAASTTTTLVIDGPPRVSIYGDSLADGFGGILKSTLDRQGVTTYLATKGSSGLSQPRFFDWPNHLNVWVPQENADVIVIGLVGERGREVREFCDETLGPESFARSVVVAAPADASPLARSKGASYATDVATWFRDQGKHVVLIIDSLTRYAMALREVGLSLGEAPVSRGYPPSVFARMPELVEQVGNGANPNGSITAFYTVLLEGDDSNDPVADTARGILDGHFFLSRELADSGHYPAIDVEKSISRVMPKVASREHVMGARRVKQLYSRYMRGRDLVSMGAYVPGSDPELDIALQCWPKIKEFLQQDSELSVGMADTLQDLLMIARA